MLKKLSELKAGDKGVIHSFEKDDIYLKLMEMGLLPGEVVVVEKIAPLHDPICIKIAGYNLALRLNEADFVWVSINQS